MPAFWQATICRMTDALPAPTPKLPRTWSRIDEAARALTAVPQAPVHLLIDSAAPPGQAFAAAWQQLQVDLAPLNDLLSKMQQTRPIDRAQAADSIQSTGADAAATLNTPFEHALASALGLPGTDGTLPWAAALQRISGPSCAWLQATHWQVGTDRIVLGHPADLALGADESDALMASMQPYLADDGLQISAIGPGLWLAQGDMLRGLRCASLDRVVGRSIDAWLPDAATPAGASVRRLMNEMQMLLYTHPVQDARQARGLPPVNSLWVHGAGQLDALLAALQPGAEPPLTVIGLTTLRDAARHGPEAWAQGWQQCAQAVVLPLLQRMQSGQGVSLTLCGEAGSGTWAFGPDHPAPAPPSLWTRLRRVVSQTKPLRPLDQLNQL